MRIVGIDFGEKRIGIAVSIDGVVVPREVITVKNENDAVEKISRYLRDERAEKIVVGLPLTITGQRGRGSEKVKRFADKLKEKVTVPVELFDERFTSADAMARLKTQGISEKEMRGKLDSVAAALLLESYESSH
jgi:putative Holliday junction resolvase